jgi:hypothetical protein
MGHHFFDPFCRVDCFASRPAAIRRRMASARLAHRLAKRKSSMRPINSGGMGTMIRGSNFGAGFPLILRVIKRVYRLCQRHIPPRERTAPYRSGCRFESCPAPTVFSMGSKPQSRARPVGIAAVRRRRSARPQCARSGRSPEAREPGAVLPKSRYLAQSRNVQVVGVNSLGGRMRRSHSDAEVSARHRDKESPRATSPIRS